MDVHSLSPTSNNYCLPYIHVCMVLTNGGRRGGSRERKGLIRERRGRRGEREGLIGERRGRQRERKSMERETTSFTGVENLCYIISHCLILYICMYIYFLIDRTPLNLIGRLTVGGYTDRGCRV